MIVNTLFTDALKLVNLWMYIHYTYRYSFKFQHNR